MLNRPSDRSIINIVKSTIAPNVRTAPGTLKEYEPINPAIHGYSVQKGTSGRDLRRVPNIKKRRVLKPSVKALREANRREGKDNPDLSPEDYEIVEEDLRKIVMEWSLPGNGKVGNPGECTTLHGSEACTDAQKGRPIAFAPIRWYCDKPTCPPCFEHWTQISGKAAKKKIEAARQLFGFYGARYRLCHVVVSPPPEHAKYLGRRKGYDLLMEDFYRVADAFDMHGYLVFHLWRGKKDDDTDVSLDVPDHADDGDYWTLGPHAHLVAFCDPERIVESSEEFYNSTGWVIKVIASDLDIQYSENVISYALSHCAIGSSEGHKDTKTLHPFGYLATSKDGGLYKLAEIKEEALKTCSECGGLIYDTKELDAGLSDDDLIPATVPLYHEVYVRRNEKEGHKALVGGLGPADILEYARTRAYEVAVVYDDKPTEIHAECDVDKANSDDMLRPGYWRSPRGGGQSRITPFEGRDPPRIRGYDSWVL